MVESLRNVFAIPELRRRVLFMLAMLAVYRIGNHIPTPGVNTEALAMLAEQARNTMFGLYDLFSGGTCRGSRSSRWASCPTSARRSSCSC
jgi:preprotein translocase subunit SecY